MSKLDERKFQKIYENIATGIALTGLDGRFVECNAAYSALTGYSQEELRKTQLFSLIHPQDLDEFRRRIDVLLEGGESQIEIQEWGVFWVRNFVSTVPAEARLRPVIDNAPGLFTMFDLDIRYLA